MARRGFARPLRPFVSRPRLSLAALLGLATGAGFLLVPNPLRASTRAILAWDVTCLVFVTGTLQAMIRQAPEQIRTRAADQDEGRGMILGLVILAAAASLAAVGLELSLAHEEHGLLNGGRILLALATVAGSWFMIQLIFAIHYAHEFYALDRRDGEGDAGGLAFPGDEPPDYWDFLHFAVIIGVACQTADIAFTSKRLRRLGTLQGVVAFVFNTVILAVSINLLAGLFQA